MGDQTDASGQPAQPQPTGAPFPGATPPPPPGAVPPAAPPAAPPATPPAAPPPATPAQTPPPGPVGAEQPVKRKRKGCWIAAGIVGVILVVLFACIGVLVVQAVSENAKKRDAYETAESHYAAAAKALDSVKNVEQRIDDSESTKVMAQQFAAEVDPAVKKAQIELDASAKALSGIEDSETKRAYLKSITAAKAALEQVTVMEEELASIGELQASLDPIGGILSKAAAELDAATTAASGGKWATGVSKARSASKRYADARSRLVGLDKAYPTMGFDVLVTDIKIRLDAANELVVVCETGRDRRVARYKAALKRFNALAAKTGKQDIPESLEDPSALLDKFWDAYTKVNEQLINADAEHDKAAEQLEAGNY